MVSIAIAAWGRDNGAVNAPRQDIAPRGVQAGKAQKEIVVRLIPFELTKYDSWQLPNHNGKDVLEMIRKLHPNVLNRFITVRPGWTAMIPMGPGLSPMPIAQYLTEVMAVCGHRCTMTAKVPLNNNAVWTDQYQKDSLQAALAMPVTPPLRALDLDNWFNRPGNYQTELKNFKAMGWKQLGFNFAGSGENDMQLYGTGSYGFSAVRPGDWQVQTRQLERMRKQGITDIQAAIDYPRPIAAFGRLSADEQADIIESISGQQKALGFTFVYPVIYGGYDATAYVTSKTGPYHGQTVFDVIVHCISRDRRQSNQL